MIQVLHHFKAHALQFIVRYQHEAPTLSIHFCNLEGTDSTLFLGKSRGTAAKVSQFCCSNSSFGPLPDPVNRKMVFMPHTNRKHKMWWYSIVHVVPFLITVPLRDSGQPIMVEHLQVPVTVHCVSYLLYSHPVEWKCHDYCCR